MKRATTTVALLVLCAIVAGPAHHAAGAVKPTGPAASLAKADCVREKGRMGKRAFLKRYGPKRGMVKCVAVTAPAAREAIAVATAACQTELDGWGLDEFLLEWESFAECVSLYADWEMDGGLEDDTSEGADEVEE